MKRFWLRWIVNAVVLLLVANLINGPGVAPNGEGDVFRVAGFLPALGAIVIISLANLLLQPLSALLRGLGCLFNWLTLGLFGLVISFVFYSFAFYVAGSLDILGGFYVAGFGPAALGALYMSLVNMLLAPVLSEDEDQRRDERERRR